MSPVEFGPSDVKNPSGIPIIQVPESYWQLRSLVLRYEGIFTHPSKPTVPNPTEGLVEFLQLCKRLNIRLGLYSPLEDKAVVDHLRELRVTECFDSIRCRGDVFDLPPAPDLYQITLDTLGIPTQKVVAFEGLAEGVAYSKSFGVFTVGLDRGDGVPTGADYSIKSFSEKPLLDLLNTIDEFQRGL